MSAIVNSQNVTFAVGGGAGSNDNLKFSNVIGGPDMSNASAVISVNRVNEPLTMDWVQLALTNEFGSNGSFTLIPANMGSGYLYAYGNGALAIKNVYSSPIWCHAFTTASPSVSTTRSADFKEVHLSTPYDYYGPSMYTANIDGQNFVLGSGAYANMVWQNVEGTDKWCVTNSGYYSI